ncbi:MAG: peptidoglycan-binding protein [Candidatus Micrarchaeota archaeon]|nr:peptidoglycan-binding protein [Candidatus Micrarchaeota archaeon]
MATEKNPDRKIIPMETKPGELNKQQIEYFKKIADGILKDLFLDLDYGGRLWREEGYQGGKSGLTDDRKKKPSRKNASKDDIKTAQQLLNALMAPNIPPEFRLTGSPLKEDGIYGPATMKKVLEFQRKINGYLKKAKKAVWVNPSDNDKELANAIAKKYGNLYDKDYISGRIGKYKYTVDMQNKTAKGRQGLITVKDLNDNIIAKIQISVDAKGKVTVNGTYLLQILEDGYLGEETRKAFLMVCNQLTEEKVVAVPVERAQRIEIGVSFQPSIYSLFAGNEILSKKYSDMLNVAGRYNIETLKIIKGIVLSLNYEDEVKLRNDKKLTIGGKEYSNSFEGITQAMLDGNSAARVYDAFANKLKSLGINVRDYEAELGFNKGVKWYLDNNTKKYCELAEYADKIKPKMEMFVKVRETSSSGEKGIVVDYSGVDEVFVRAIKNIESTLPKDSPYTDLVLADVYEKRARAIQIIKTVEKESKNEGEVLEKLNKNDELCTLVFNTFKMYGNALFKSNYFDAIGLEITNPTLFKKAVSDIIKSTNTNLKELCEMFGISTSSTNQEFADSFYNGIKMGKISDANVRELRENPQMMAFFMAAYKEYLSRLREETRQKEKKKAKTPEAKPDVLKEF